MQPLNDEQLDQMVADRLIGELASQEGRAVRHFREMTAAPVAPARRWPQLRRWAIGLAAGAAAACVGLFLADLHSGSGGTQPTPRLTARPVTPADTGSQWVRREQTVQWGTIDEGIVLARDGEPLQQLRRVEVQRIRLINAKGQTVLETVVPREQMMYIDAPTY